MAQTIQLTVQYNDGGALASLKSISEKADKLNGKKVKVGIDTDKLKDAPKVIKDTGDGFKELGKQAEKTGDTLASSWKKMLLWSAAGTLIFAPIRAFKEALSTLKDIDDELVTVRKVTGLAGDALKELENQAYATASAYGVSADKYLESVSAFSRAGYQDLSAGLAELSTKTQIVGDTSADVANQFLLTVDAAYKYNGSVTELTKVLDGANEIDNRYATSISNIAEGLGKVAPIAAQAHVGINELTAAIGTITAKTQRSGTEAATALRALMLNIIGDTKTEIDEGVTWTTGEIAGLRDVIKQYAPEAYKAAEATGSLINPMEAIGGLAKSMQDGLLTEQKLMAMVSDIGGKLRTSQLLALIQNWDTYQSMLVDYGNAIGSADKEVANAMDSWTRKTEILKNTWVEFVRNVADTELIKGGLDALIAFVEILDTGFGKAIISAGALTLAIGGIPKIIEKIGDITAWNPKIFAITAAVTLLVATIKTISDAIPTTAELKQKADESKQAVQSTNDELKNTKSRIEELEDMGSLTLIEQEELNKLKESNDELERQLVARKLIAEESNKELRKKLKDDFDKLAYGDAVRGGGTFLQGNGDKKQLSFVEEVARQTELAKKGSEEAELALAKMRETLTGYLEQYDKDDETSRYWESLRHDIDAVLFPAKTALADLDELGNGIVYSLEQQAAQGILTAKSVSQLADKYPELNKWLWETRTSTGELAEHFNALAREQNDVAISAKQYKNAAVYIDELSKSYNMLATAEREMAEKGKLSLASVKAIMEAGFGKYLKNTENGYILTKSALDELTDAQIEAANVAINEARTGAINLINQNSDEKIAIDATTEAIKLKLQALQAEASVKMAQARGTGTASDTYLRGSWVESNKAYQEAKATFAAARAALANLEGSETQLADLKTVISSLGDEFAQTGKKAKDAAKEASQALSTLSSIALEKYKAQLDPIIDGLDAQIDSLKANLESLTDGIDNQLDALEKAYKTAKDAADEQKDAWKEARDAESDAIDEKIDALEKARDLAKEAADEQIQAWEDARDAEIAAIQEKIDAMQAEHDAQEESNVLEEKKLALIKAQQDLVTAQSERTVRYYDQATGQWNWEADRRDVLNAQKSVEDAQKELDDYIKELGYEHAIAELKAQQESIRAQYDAWIDTLEAQQEAAEKEYKANIDVLKAQKESIREQYDAWIKNLEAQQKAAKKEYDAQKEVLEAQKKAIKAQYDAQIDAAEAQKKAAQAQYDAYKASWDALSNSLKETTTNVSDALSNLSKVAPELVDTVVGLLGRMGVNTGGFTGGGGNGGSNGGGSSYPGTLIKQGQTSDLVKQIQAALNVRTTGYFGTETLAAVKEFQRSRGLKVDGIVGRDTWSALFGNYDNGGVLTSRGLYLKNNDEPEYVYTQEQQAAIEALYNSGGNAGNYMAAHGILNSAKMPCANTIMNHTTGYNTTDSHDVHYHMSIGTMEMPQNVAKQMIDVLRPLGLFDNPLP